MTNVKLTLNIQDTVISKAKQHAKRQNVSLSKIVEHYLAALAEEDSSESIVSPWTKDLAAVKKPTPDFDHKKGYRDHIADKYSS